jgi:adenylosuccinate lyase
MDTAFSIQLKRSCDILISGIENIERVLLSLAEKYKDLVAIGRTHGIHAEPTTLGLKFLSHYAEFRRARKRLMMGKEEVSFGKISGAVGVYETIPPEVEDYVLTKFGLKPEPVATQVVPRDRYAFFALTCSLLASAIERLAFNIRISQMTEIDEINEPFEEEQMGSSVMPHKRNPVLSENLTGLSRYFTFICGESYIP